MKMLTNLAGLPIKRIGLGFTVLIAAMIVWPFYSVPTGSRGVVTQFGKIVGIEDEGLAVLPPWRRLYNFRFPDPGGCLVT
jgi:prohibitin 2